MKTDRFSDAIRRKLESIRPEFTDKDWTRMQGTLHQAGFPQPDPGVVGNPFSGGVWSSNSWWLAAASVSTVALIGVGIWQRNQINDLRQTVSQLQQKATPTQVAPASPTSESPTRPQTDGSSSDSQAAKSPSAQAVPFESALREPNTARLQRDTVYADRYVAVPAPRQQTNLNLNPKNDTYDVSSTPSSTNKPVLTKPNQSIAASPSINQPAGSGRLKEKLRDKPGRSGQYADTYSPTKPGKEVINQPVQTAPQLESIVETVNGVSANYEPIAGQPLSTKSLNWNALLARQAAKRMRPSRPATPVVEQAPTAQPESQVEHVAVQVRVGVGAEIASHLWSKGVFAEVLLGRNWLLGLGLNQTTYSYTFIDDFDFKQHTHRDFRDEFVPPMNRNRDILNINAQTTRLQIPVYLGYRVPITPTVAFVPTVGTYLNLNSTEEATYYSPIFGPVRGYDEFTTNTKRPVELINSLAFGTGVEWQSKHWVAQASPVLTLPFQSQPKPMQPEPNWQQNTTIGLRARVLYQF